MSDTRVFIKDKDSIGLQWNNVPKTEKQRVYSVLLEAIRRYMSDSEVQKQFEAWKKARAEKEDAPC